MLSKAATLVACIGSVLSLAGPASSAAAPSEAGAFPVPESVYLPDFSYAGYAFGERPIPTVDATVIDITVFGVVADDYIDDSKGFLAALEAADAVDGPVILQLPKGRINLSEVLPISRSNIVIRGHGDGPDGSTLYFPRPLEMVGDDGRLDELREYLIRYDKRQKEPNRNIDLYFSEYSWSGGFFWVGRDGSRPESYLEELDIAVPVQFKAKGSRGSHRVEVDSDAARRLTAGDWIKVVWRNADGKGAPLLTSIYGETDLEIGSRLWSSPTREIVSQKTRVVSVEENIVTIGDPLLHDANESIAATIEPWAPLQEVGFEDFYIEFPDSVAFGHHLERGYNGIYITGTANGWIRNVSFRNADSGILTYDSSNLTISNITMLGDRYGHYAVHLGSVHNVLAEDIKVFAPVEHSFTFNTKSTRSVYKDAVAYSMPVLDQHAGANHQNLFDNVTLYVEAQQSDDGYFYPAFNGSGAAYWEPGHGRYNTTWNLSIQVKSGPLSNESVEIQGIAEGPDARIIGLSGNRELTLDYRPQPYVSHLNKRIESIPSLYDYQLRKRLMTSSD